MKIKTLKLQTLPNTQKNLVKMCSILIVNGV